MAVSPQVRLAAAIYVVLGVGFGLATRAFDLPAVLAARGTVVIVSTPLGIALGGPLVGLLGGGATLAASGLATVLLAAVALLVWPREATVAAPA